MELADQTVDRNVFDDCASTLRLLRLRLVLINEEVEELARAVELFADWASISEEPELKANSQQIAVIDILDALGDILYVTYGFFHVFGFDVDRVFDAIHKSNCSKIGRDGPIYREDGKVLKGLYYEPPQIAPILTGYLHDVGVEVALDA
jgi:predicted HAD superfamily Cof-like phosphohydrolase